MSVSSFMKSGGIAALALGLAFALPAAASAQERGWGHRGGEHAQNDSGDRQGRGDGGNRGEGRGGGWQARQQQAPQVQAQPRAERPAWRQTAPQQSVQQQPRERQGWNRGGDQRGTGMFGMRTDNDRRQEVQRTWNNNTTNRWQGGDRDRARPDTRRWDGNRRLDGNRSWGGNTTRRWDNNWRRDNRYNWYSYRNSNRNIFRMDRYYSPYRNWSYRRLSIGFMLQPLFYSSNYWINDPWQYRLPEAYGPYRWVRYYDDALLVDIYTGEVVDVIPDFFW